MRRSSSVVSLLGFLTVAVGSAWAGGINCTTFASANSNGTTTFPGTFVGTVGTAANETCQIGNLSVYNGGSGGAFVNGSHDPSIYSFYWGGGELGITEQIGNNGIGDGIDVSVYSLSSDIATSPGSLIASAAIPFSSGPSATDTVYGPQSLNAGYYAIETQLAANTPDPNFQIDFTASAATPEPASVWLLGLGALALVAGMRRRGMGLGTGL